MIRKGYSELIKLRTFEERFEYLKTKNKVGESTFGHARHLNQSFYRSAEWRRVRDRVIVRDGCCDLACEDRPIEGERVIVHHISPLTIKDVTDGSSNLFDLENLICVSETTHNAITYGTENVLRLPTERKQFDTCPWKSSNEN